jgi:hypothetical protein
VRYLRVDSLALRARSGHVWRGLDLGRVPLGAALDLSLWRIDGVRDRHALTGRLAADVPLVDRGDARRTDLFESAVGYRYRLDTEQGELHVGAVGRQFAGQPGERFSPEVAAAVQRRVDVPLTELRPIVALSAARDLRRFEATWLAPSATLDFGLPPVRNGTESYGGRIVVGTSVSDYAKRRGGRAFGHHATTAEFWATYDRATSAVGPLVAELGFAQWWTNVAPSPRRFVATFRVVKR